MGIFCGLGAILLTHLTASEREPAAVRVAAAAALPVVAVTLYFTFSRGGHRRRDRRRRPVPGARHPRGLVGALPAVGLPVAFALQRAYGAELLAREYYAEADAREQGRALLVVVIGCVVAAAVLRDARAARRPADARDPRSARGRAAAVRRPPGSRRWSPSRSRASPSTCRIASTSSARRSSRATRHRATRSAHAADEVGNNGRLEQWRIALDAAERAALARGRRRDVPAASGSASGPRRPCTSSTPTRSTSSCGPSSAGSGSSLLAIALVVPLVVAAARLAGPGATRTRPSSPRASPCCSTPASTGTGRCRRSSSGSSARPGSCSRAPAERAAACPRRGG